MRILINGFRSPLLQTFSLLRHSIGLRPKFHFFSNFCAALSISSEIVSPPRTDSSRNGFEFNKRFQNILKKLSVHSQPLTQVENFGSHESLCQLSELLGGCASKDSLNEGKIIHGKVIKNGLNPYLNIWNLLVGFYVKCGVFEDAVKMMMKCLNEISCFGMS